MSTSVKWSILGVILLVAVMLVAVPRMLGSVDRAAEPTAPGGGSAESSVTASPAEQIPARPACPALGVGAVELPCLGGESGPLSADTEPAGTGAAVVNLWAWWCGPCRDELPVFDEFAQAHPEYDVIGVHADPNPANGAAMLNDLGVDLPSYQDSDNLFAGTLGLPGVVPITVVIRDGEQVAMFPTPFDSVETLETAVSEALA